MNDNIAEGKLDQVKGKVKQSVGEAFGNQKLANSGAADEVKGAAKEAWGNTTDAARAATSDAHDQAEVKHTEAKQHAEETGHDLRDKITSAAQNVKKAINNKAEEVRENHRHTA